MKEVKKNFQDSAICPVQLNTLKNFISFKPSKENCSKEAIKAADLLLALSKKEDEKKTSAIDAKNSIKLSSNLMQDDIKKEQKVESSAVLKSKTVSNDDLYKEILYAHIFTAGDFKTLSVYLKSEISLELRKEIEEYLKKVDKRVYDQFITAELLEVDIQYEELNQEKQSEINSNIESMKLLEALLLDIPDSLSVTIEELDTEQKDIGVANKLKLISLKKQTISIHEMLKKTFNILDYNNKEKFNTELQSICEKHQSKDANFSNSLYNMCKRFTQQNKNKAASKLVQR